MQLPHPARGRVELGRLRDRDARPCRVRPAPPTPGAPPTLASPAKAPGADPLTRRTHGTLPGQRSGFVARSTIRLCCEVNDPASLPAQRSLNVARSTIPE